MPDRPSLAHLVGIPFLSRGRDPRVGLDCWGLARLAFAEFGLDIGDYRISAFDSAAINKEMERERAKGRWRRVRRPEVPCLVVMRNNRRCPRDCNHVGVYLGYGRMLHTQLRSGSHTVPVDHGYWQQAIEGFYIYAG